MRLPPLKSLQAFEAAGRTESFQEAANELNVTPSAISHQVKSLEEYLGIQLFERKTRKVTLTLTGEVYLESIAGAFQTMESATRRLMVGQGGDELKLAVAPAFLERWLLPRFQDFTERYPDIEMDIHSSIGEIDFAQSDIDMAVYFGDGQWSGIDCQFLRSSYLVPVCSPYLLEQERVMEPEDLLKFRLLSVRKRPEEWPQWFQLTDTPYQPSQGTISFSNGMNTANAATRGLGVALTDPSLVSEEIENGDLMVPIDIMMQQSKSFYLVTQKNRPFSSAMSAFQQWITQRMAMDVSM
ncbi:transcriptional regulator GcvA [Reinekea blandensis]|uniref:Transcriptional regulator, LysR family protein n=1 Tax=Reinekea blandensis MED297 TaxID=314283 RepID=A4BBA0_9GAMM|nr:transcriptional regulator GcvA [Reinekea blandensis]EAR10713.1 transcriptional regulator, LysR family protein [Reinekea sp. MED297] [Reinekea blandensis MED297]